MTPVRSKMTWSPERGAALFLALAFFGAVGMSVVGHPISHRPANIRRMPPAAAVGVHGEVHAAKHPSLANISARDLRLPRAPRHRCDRPSSGAAEVEALVDAVVVAIIDGEAFRPCVLECPTVRPLDGHPLSVLRPPSLLAG